MRCVNVANLARFGDDKMQKIPLFDSARFFCDVYCLKTGQAQRAHAHPDADKVYYVLKGHATVQVGDEVGLVEAGEAVLAPAGSIHGITNQAADPLTLLVFMAPKPAAGG